jgi:hypothetical protein
MYNFLSDPKVLTLHVHKNITQRAYKNTMFTKKKNVYFFNEQIKDKIE